MSEQQPTNFLEFALETLGKETLSFGAGLVCAAGYYAVARAQAPSETQLWRNTAIVYTITSLAATGLRVLFSKNES